MKAFAHTLTGKRADADDLVQETFAKVTNAWHTYTPGTNAFAWASMIMRNQYYSEKRRSWRNVTWDEDVHDTLLSKDAVADGAEHVIEMRRMLLCLTALNQEQRDAVVAVGYLGLDYETAARVFGCSVGTVKSRVSRGRSELTRLVDDVTEFHGIDLGWYRTATKGVPESHPFYIIAKAYEEMFAEIDPAPLNGAVAKQTAATDADAEWHKLVASGVLDIDLDGE